MLESLIEEVVTGKLGSDLRGVCWFDIETAKVSAPSYWGYKTRWQPFMIGMLYERFVGRKSRKSEIVLEVITSQYESELVDGILARITPMTEMRYSATREFDQMVLCGRFTNARRAHSLRPGLWSHLAEEEFDWVNLRSVLGPEDLAVGTTRLSDCISKEVPVLWDGGGDNRMLVALHCARDVADMALRDTTAMLPTTLRDVLYELCTDKVTGEQLRWWESDGNPGIACW